MVPEKEVASGGGRHTRNVFFLALILLILYILGGCASTGTTTSPPAGQKEFYVPAVDEELFGTWVNEDYRPPSFTPKVIIYPWGLVEWFADIQDKVSSWIGTSIVVEKWTDEQGATWYKDYRRGTDLSFYGGNAFVLDRISSDERVLESVCSTTGWPNPSEMDPNQNPTYVKYRRQE